MDAINVRLIRFVINDTCKRFYRNVNRKFTNFHFSFPKTDYTRDTRENLISIHVLLKFPDVNSLRPSFLRTLFSFFLPFFLSQACLDYTGSLEGWMPRQSLKHLR